MSTFVSLDIFNSSAKRMMDFINQHLGDPMCDHGNIKVLQNMLMRMNDVAHEMAIRKNVDIHAKIVESGPGVPGPSLTKRKISAVVESDNSSIEPLAKRHDLPASSGSLPAVLLNSVIHDDWTEQEEQRLKIVVATTRFIVDGRDAYDWGLISREMMRSPDSCRQKWRDMCQYYRKGPYTVEEDAVIVLRVRQSWEGGNNGGGPTIKATSGSNHENREVEHKVWNFLEVELARPAKYIRMRWATVLNKVSWSSEDFLAKMGIDSTDDS